MRQALVVRPLFRRKSDKTKHDDQPAHNEQAALQQWIDQVRQGGVCENGTGVVSLRVASGSVRRASARRTASSLPIIKLAKLLASPFIAACKAAFTNHRIGDRLEPCAQSSIGRASCQGVGEGSHLVIAEAVRVIQIEFLIALPGFLRRRTGFICRRFNKRGGDGCQRFFTASQITASR